MAPAVRRLVDPAVDHHFAAAAAADILRGEKYVSFASKRSTTSTSKM
jgi:hypothetical protein